jgi:hypothetical protein
MMHLDADQQSIDIEFGFSENIAFKSSSVRSCNMNCSKVDDYIAND